MQTMDIKRLLKLPESKTLEFKRDLSSLDPVIKTLVAFANTAGGVLIVGREDGGSVVGVSSAKAEEERLANIVADAISPTLMPDIEIAGTKSQPLIVIRVARWPGPFFVKRMGSENGVYLRLGSTNRKASPSQIAELKRISEHIAFDQHACHGTTARDLDMRLVKSVFHRAGRNIDDAKLEGLGVFVRHGRELTPSNGAIILFGRQNARSKYFPDAQIRCARFAGVNKVEFLDRLSIDKPVLSAVGEAMAFIRRNSRMAAKIRDLQREDIPEYPVVALREVLVNAVAHTDYSLRGMQIMLAIYSDRLEIQSPGTFPAGMTIDDFKAGLSRIRNPIIVKALRNLDLMEEWGSGYKRIEDACKDGGYPCPEWFEVGPTVRVVFRPHALVNRADEPINEPVNEPAKQRALWFIEKIEAGKHVAASDLVKQFGVSPATAKRDIANLKEEGLIEFIGARKSGHYRLKK